VNDLSQAIWRKASLSALNGGCVEVAANLPGVAAVRDSERPEAGAHVVDRDAFARFLLDVQGGRYDI
jgi:uncharacterized protein DUF397